jgi:hypothetical protein
MASTAAALRLYPVSNALFNSKIQNQNSAALVAGTSSIICTEPDASPIKPDASPIEPARVEPALSQRPDNCTTGLKIDAIVNEAGDP